MKLREPDVRKAFLLTELGCVMNSGSLDEIIMKVRHVGHRFQTNTDPIDVLSRSPFVKGDHFGGRVLRVHVRSEEDIGKGRESVRYDNGKAGNAPSPGRVDR